MFACPSCATPVGASDRSCPACGSGLDIADSPTGTAPRPGAPVSSTPSPSPERTPSSGLRRPGGERFVPGTVLAGRYRITGLLGRGGMGEVYRADDLKLDQAVALKFLPHGLDADGGRLGRFYREVRVARQVSHPAVCRMYDVGEAEGHFFLSMELVDGENLASLLRRIGRLPPDKALDIARQLCAGPRRRAREGRPAPGPQARQPHARRPGERAHHGLRPGRPRRVAPRGGRAVGDPLLHVARAAAGTRGERPQRHLRARPRAVRAVHRPPRVPGQVAGRVRPQAPRRAADRALGPRGRPRPRGREGDPGLSREGAAPPPVLGARRLRDADRQRPARGGDRGGRDAVARARRGGGGGRGPASRGRLGPARRDPGRARARSPRRSRLPAGGAGPGRESRRPSSRTVRATSSAAWRRASPRSTTRGAFPWTGAT